MKDKAVAELFNDINLHCDNFARKLINCRFVITTKFSSDFLLECVVFSFLDHFVIRPFLSCQFGMFGMQNRFELKGIPLTEKNITIKMLEDALTKAETFEQEGIDLTTTLF